MFELGNKMDGAATLKNYTTNASQRRNLLDKSY